MESRNLEKGHNRFYKNLLTHLWFLKFTKCYTVFEKNLFSRSHVEVHTVAELT